MITCSACGSQLTVGSATCPRCNPPLTAHAVHVQPRRMSTLSFVLLVLLCFAVGSMVIGHAADSLFFAPKREASHTALMADIQSNKLSDPEVFQARCGRALSIHDEKDGKTLSYSHGDIHVKLDGGPPKFFRVQVTEKNGNFREIEMPVGADFALPYLNCEQTH